jgi:hypothetical protein
MVGKTKKTPLKQHRGVPYQKPAPKTDRRDQLCKDLSDELSHSRDDWKGEGVQIRRHENPVKNKPQVQAQGLRYGCHTCLTKLSTDNDQPWIGDHIPPTNLSAAARSTLGVPTTQATVLFAQCDLCAEEQSELVRKLNRLRGDALVQAVANLRAEQRQLLLGGATKRAAGQYVPSSGPKVSPAEGEQVQDLGEKYGCHSCATRRPKAKYHADHCPPVLMHLPTVHAVMRKIGMKPPTSYEAKPQCPKCSHNQGGSMSPLKKIITEIAREYDMPIYW